MSDTDDPRFSYTFIWQCLENACQKCQELAGVEWTTSTWPPTLDDPFYGPVWDLEQDQSLAHQNCKCLVVCNAEFHPEQWQELNDYRAQLLQFTGGTDVSDNSDLTGIQSLVQGLQQQMDDSNISMRQAEMSIMRVASAFDRLGLPKSVKEAITEIMRLIQTIRLLTVGLTMMEAAEGPVGWLFGGMNLLAAGVTASQAVAELG